MGYTLDNLRVLVIDQNAHFRQLLRTILQSVGARTIDLSDNAVAGFETYCCNVYDVVLADDDMDTLSGFELVDLIRTSRQSPNPYVPIIMLSADCNEERIKRARDHGVTEFLAKPFTVDIALKRLESVIENPRSFVRTAAYFGPERRRKFDNHYDGLERRTSTPDKLTLSMQEIMMQQRAALVENKRVVDELLRD